MLFEKIYTLRRKNRLSQEQLAEKTGVSRQAISKWEGGLSTPELDKLKALSECFQITIDELTDVMCAAVAYNYCTLQWCGQYGGCSAPADTAFLLCIPYGVGIIICVTLTWIFSQKHRKLM